MPIKALGGEFDAVAHADRALLLRTDAPFTFDWMAEQHPGELHEAGPVVQKQDRQHPSSHRTWPVAAEGQRIGAPADDEPDLVGLNPRRFVRGAAHGANLPTVSLEKLYGSQQIVGAGL